MKERGPEIVSNPFEGAAAALFDLDGTLVETHIDFPLMKREMLTLAARRGVDGAALEALDILGVVEAARRQLEDAGRPESARRFRAEAFAALERIEVEHCAAPVPIPGAAELLRLLRAAGLPVGVVTRNCRRVALDLLRSGALEYDALLTRDDVPLTKPDPAHLLAALEALGVRCSVFGVGAEHRTPNTEHRAVMTGDHWMDVQAGRAAGMRTVGVLRGRPRDFFAPAPPDLLVQEVEELLPMAEALTVTRAQAQARA